MGRYSDFEAREESFYVDEALAIVEELWEGHQIWQIAQCIRARTGYAATPKLVWSLKQRLDRSKRNGT